SRVASGRLDNRSSGPQPTAPFRLGHHRQRHPILDAAAWIERLHFGVNLCLEPLHHAPQTNERRLPYRLQDRILHERVSWLVSVPFDIVREGGRWGQDKNST